jgi:hypothetical protein
MELIEGVALSKLCDYSFGDQSGQWGNIYTSFMKDANLTNVEFVSKLFEIKKSRDYMTLFIDNIRLYKREIAQVKPEDRPYVNSLMETSDLLSLCANFPDMRFIIFTNLEDTPIDDYIFDLIPNNVLSINAVNAISYGEKVIPSPYGIQRKMNPTDNRSDYLESYMTYSEPENFNQLLYVSHSEDTNSERVGIKKIFENSSWAKVDNTRVDYPTFLSNLWKSKFMICPIGNAIDCHRNWEVLYMKRVPVMKRYPYLEKLFEQYPVLFVDSYSEITQDLLIESDYLYQEAKNLDLDELTLPKYFDRIVETVLRKNDCK